MEDEKLTRQQRRAIDQAAAKASAPGNGHVIEPQPEPMMHVDITLPGPNGKHARLSVPVGLQPLELLQIVAFITAEVPKALANLEQGRGIGSGIVVPQPGSIPTGRLKS